MNINIHKVSIQKGKLQILDSTDLGAYRRIYGKFIYAPNMPKCIKALIILHIYSTKRTNEFMQPRISKVVNPKHVQNWVMSRPKDILKTS